MNQESVSGLAILIIENKTASETNFDELMAFVEIKKAVGRLKTKQFWPLVERPFLFKNFLHR